VQSTHKSAVLRTLHASYTNRPIGNVSSLIIYAANQLSHKQICWANSSRRKFDLHTPRTCVHVSRRRETLRARRRQRAKLFYCCLDKSTIYSLQRAPPEFIFIYLFRQAVAREESTSRMERENSLCSSAAFCLFGFALFCAERARWARAIPKSITFQTLVIASVCCYYHYHARRYPSERGAGAVVASAPPQRRRLWRNRQPARHANVLSLGRCANKNIIIAIIPSPFIAVHGCAFSFYY